MCIPSASDSNPVAEGSYIDAEEWLNERARPTPWGPEGAYTLFMKGGKQIAGMMKAQSENMPPSWGIYFATDDVDGVAEKVTAAGGQTYMEPQNMPEVGRMAILAAPQGSVFGIVDPPSQSP